MDISETINDHFTNVAQVLAQDIPVVAVNPESHLKPTDHSFSVQIPSVDIFLIFCENWWKESHRSW